MPKVRIAVLLLGTLDDYKITELIDKIEHKRNYSKIYEIVSFEKITLDNADAANGTCSKFHLLDHMGEVPSDADVLLGFTQFPLTGGYFSDYLEKQKHIVSFSKIENILRDTEISINNYVRVMLIKSTLCFKTKNIDIFNNLKHDNIKGCIFDYFSVDINNILKQLSKPFICDVCKGTLRTNTDRTDNHFFENVDSELKKIKKTLFLVLLNKIKKHPIVSIIITAVASIILSLISSFIWEYLHPFCTNW
jgi:hypothetical protein